MSFKFNPFTGTLDIYPSASAVGDVDGPASSTDNAIVRFDGTTGKLIQNSSSTISDTGDVSHAVTDGQWKLISTAGGSPNILAGYSGNSIASGTYAALIHGGGTLTSVNSIVGSTSSLATICGGYDNVITDGLACTIGGGAHHRIQTSHGTVCGGSYNLIGSVGANADYSIICGGTLNSIESDQCFIGGGSNHSIAANHTNAVIVGGSNNDITGAGTYGSILGGYNNSLGAGTGSTIIGTRITLSGSNTVAMGDNFTETASNVFSTRFTAGHYLQGRVVIGATSATATSQDLDIYPSSSSTGGILISRAGTGSTNAADWGFRVRNSANTDSFRMSQSSSAYTTGGTFGWVGNSMGFLYYPTEMRIGTGVGSSPTMTFTSTGLVGIGTASPANKLHIYRGAGGGSAGDTTNDVLIIENNLSAGVNIITPTNGQAGFYFSDDVRAIGRVIYDHSLNTLSFFTSSSQRLTVDSAGDVGIGITTSFAAKLHIIKTTEQLRIGYDTSNYYSTTVSSTGVVTLNAVGSGSSFVFSDNVLMSARHEGIQGSDVASANDLTLGQGNSFEITGTTQINAITTTNWQLGSIVTLLFTSTPTVKHNTAGGANTAVILLAGSVDFSATAGDTLSLIYSEIGGTNAWREIGRAVI